MRTRIRLTLSEEKVTIEQLSKKGLKYATYNESLIKDGVIQNHKQAIKYLKHKISYASLFSKLTYVIPSNHILRWYKELPMMTPKELQLVLKHHSKRILPRKTEGYSLYYRTIPLGDKIGVGLLGIPNEVIQNYHLLNKGLGRKGFSVDDPADLLGEQLYRQTKEEKMILFYKLGDRIYGSVVEKGLCLMVQSMREEAIKNSEEEWIASVTRLMYSTHHPVERGIYIIDENQVAEETSYWVSKVRETLKVRFNEQVSLLSQINQCEGWLSNKWKPLESILRKREPLTRVERNRLWINGCLGILTCYTIGMIGQVGYHYLAQNKLEAYLASNQAHQVAYEDFIRKQEHITFKEQLIQVMDEEKIFFSNQLENLTTLEEKIPLSQWGINQSAKEVYGVVSVENIHQLMHVVPVVEKHFPNQVMTYDYQDTNRWGENRLTFLIEKEDAQ